MKMLADACAELNQTLIQVSQRCQATHHTLEEFSAAMSAVPLALLGEQLRRIISQIRQWTELLYSRNSGKGFVYVKMTKTEPTVIWEEKHSAQDKEWWKARGAMVLSPDQVITLTEALINQFKPDHMADAVFWIHYWESCLVYDGKKCLGQLL